jgi:hypothetical protein
MYENDPEFVSLYMQTVFEGYSTNTFQNGLNSLTGSEHELVDPFYAHHPGEPPDSPHFMGSYGVGGTPWTVLFGKDGEVLSSHVSFDENYITLGEMIEEALAAE